MPLASILPRINLVFQLGYRSLVHVKPSMIFDTVQVRDIALISFSMAPGGHTLGKGVTMKYLSRDGTLTPLP